MRKILSLIGIITEKLEETKNNDNVVKKGKKHQPTHDSGKKQKKPDKYPMLCIQF
jgi:hypothetical protein